MKRQKKIEQGFTIIELVMVIVVISILAATAIPLFIDLSVNAAQATVNSVAGALSTASANNFAGCAANAQRVTAGQCVTVNSCAGIAALLNPPLTVTVYNASTTRAAASFSIDDATGYDGTTTSGTSSTTGCTLYYYRLEGPGSAPINIVSANFTLTVAGQ